MASLIAEVAGWAVLLVGAGAVALAVGRRASARGILAPLLVAAGLRLVVMLIAHAGSLSLGDEGLLFLDDQTYLRQGTALADEWSDGGTPDPSRHDLAGSYQFGFQVFVGGLFTLGAPSVLVGKLANVLIGVLTVYVVARLAGVLLGERAQVRAAWIAALAPNLVWWSSSMMKEALATLLVALGALAIVSLPRRAAVGGLVAVVAALVLVRVPAALALMAGTGAALVVAGRQAERRWLSRPVVVFATVVLCGLTAMVLAISQGQPGAFLDQYTSTTDRMIDAYQGSNPARWPYDVAKSLVTPLPWTFDSDTRHWDRGLYPGMWLLFCAYPLALLGLRRLGTRPELVGLGVMAATALGLNALTSGFTFRQRSVVEPIVLLLVVAGMPSWRFAGRVAAAALAVVAVAAGVQSRSPVVVLAILAAAGAVLLASRRLRDDDLLEPLPPSPMVEGLREAGAAERPGGVAARVAADLAWLARTVVAAARGALRGVVSAAPPLRERKPGIQPGAAARAWRLLVDLAPRR